MVFNHHDELTEEQKVQEWPPVVPPSLRSRRKSWLRSVTHAQGREALREVA